MNETRNDGGITPGVVPLLTKPVEPFVATVYCGWFCHPDGTKRADQNDLIVAEYAAGSVNGR